MELLLSSCAQLAFASCIRAVLRTVPQKAEALCALCVCALWLVLQGPGL